MLESLRRTLSGLHDMSEFCSWPQRIVEGDRGGEKDIKGCCVVQRWETGIKESPSTLPLGYCCSWESGI